LVKSLSGGLGLKTRRPPGRFCRALRFRFSFFLPAGIPVVPIQASILSHSHAHTSHPPMVRPEKNPRNKPGTTLTPSGGTSETRYSVPDNVIAKHTGHKSKALERYKHLFPQLRKQTVQLI